jgi:hypothetical protein
MKKQEIPQDPSALNNVTKEVAYAVDDAGNYTTDLSTGWSVKAEALDHAWQDIENRVADARGKVERKEASPLLYFMERKLMDIKILSAYTGFWGITIKRHLKYSPFQKLSRQRLEKYAEVFDISVDELKKPF